MSSNTFRSYIGGSDSDDGDLRPLLHPGEVVIAQANQVIKFTAHSDLAKGIMGKLFITNFKISFVSADISCYRLVDNGQPNILLGATDVCLINVESVYQVNENKKSKKLIPGSSISARAPILKIICRDLRTHVFSFKFTPISDDKAVTNAILHHAFPPRLQLLFAFEYKGSTPTEDCSPFGTTTKFNNVVDWEHEMERVSCRRQWRVTHVNEHFNMTRTHPDKYVVPSFILDRELTNAAPYFQGNRIPSWSWGNSEGYVIARSSNFTSNANENQQKYMMLNALARTHPTNDVPLLFELDNSIPSVKEINQSHVKLLELCTPDSPSQFWEQDSRFLSDLEATQWLRIVWSCLGVAKRVATAVTVGKKSVLLQEGEGRDLTCIISSLAQIILDKYFRTIIGFQSLVQKEWVAMGHPFLTRLGRLKNRENESLVFLVFLDCVWQLLQQFPAAFQFTETYLTTLWDSAHISTFDTFLFDSEKERRDAVRSYERPFQLRSIWNWGLQLSKDQTVLFLNPLYAFSEDLVLVTDEDESSEKAQNWNSFEQQRPVVPIRVKKMSEANRTSWAPGNSEQRNRGQSVTVNQGNARNKSGMGAKSTSLWTLRSMSGSVPEIVDLVTACRKRWTQYEVLPVQVEVPFMKVWTQCYFRWLLLAQINGGGPPVAHLQQTLLLKEVRALRRLVIAYHYGESVGDMVVDGPSVTTAKDPKEVVTSAHPFSAGGITPAHGLPLSFYKQSSYINLDDDDLYA